VLIDGEYVATFGRVTMLRVESIGGSGEAVGIAYVELISSLNPNSLEPNVGVSESPGLDCVVYKAHPAVVRLVTEANAICKGKRPTVTIDFAHLANIDETNLTTTPEMLFGRHMAILGSTGSGKSFSLSRITEEVGKYASKFILLDPSGEYANLSGNVLHVCIGNKNTTPEGAYPVSLPYYELIESDLFSIFRPSGEGQAPRLRAAIKSLKLAKLEPEIALDGFILKANRDKRSFEDAAAEFHRELEAPVADFDITKLVVQINNECVNPYRSSTEGGYWGDYNSLAQSMCTPLINRVEDIINAPNLAPIFNPDEIPSIFEVINRFIAEENYNVLCVSLQHLSFEHHTREIVANALGRHLLHASHQGMLQDKPVVIALDEAHQFLNEATNEKDNDYPLNSFDIIAKEGRKYGLHICLATQRPRDLPEGVLSQVGTFVVHRLTNDADRSIIERASGNSCGSALEALPTLLQGEAVLFGADFAVPVKVKVKMPSSKPISYSADFQKDWALRD
ncbi:MAG: ATP-binding protein, partial [Bdellovibrionales bacterium]|nr:ATP-binding protein [Bdellovibrionales bacterium]